MVWLLVVLVCVLAIGPILWLLPSQRDKHVSRCRAAARRAGLIVEVTSVPKLDAPAAERVSAAGVARDAILECVAYRLPLPVALVDAPRWRLLKSPHENRHLSGWTTLTPPSNVPPAGDEYWQRLAAIVNALPGGCVAVEATARSIAWLGLERMGESSVEEAIADIGAGLAAIVELHEDFSA